MVSPLIAPDEFGGEVLAEKDPSVRNELRPKSHHPKGRVVRSVRQRDRERELGRILHRDAPVRKEGMEGERVRRLENQSRQAGRMLPKVRPIRLPPFLVAEQFKIVVVEHSQMVAGAESVVTPFGQLKA